jgi:hypothetical protein
MTRELTDNNPLWSFGSVRPLGAYAFGNSGADSGSYASVNFGGARMNPGTTNAGYARATLYEGLNQLSAFSGTGIRFFSGGRIAVSVVTGILTIRDEVAYRLVVGGNGGVPAASDSNALTTPGFGVEIVKGTPDVATSKARLFAHNGTSYVTSGFTADFDHGDYKQQQFIVSWDNGTIYLHMSVGASPPRPSATPVLTLTNGPTNTSGGNFIDFVAVNNSTNAPSDGFSQAYFFGGMVEVK